MHRATVVAVGLAAAAGVAVWMTHRASPPRRPHVVLIFLDTLRADRLNSYNPDLPKGVSPELDELARRGVRFATVIAQSSWTRPSLGSLLTSRYPRSLGLHREIDDPLPRSALTLAEVLKGAGYRTLGITANPHLNRIFNFEQGFDGYVESNVVFRFMRRGPNERHISRADLMSSREVYDRALEMTRDPSSQPIYLQLNVMDVHEYRNPRLIRSEFDELFGSHRDAEYLRAVRQVSLETKRFLNELAGRPGWEDTLFILTSDHGEGLDDHPSVKRSRGHGRLLYESQLRVPLILLHKLDRSPEGRVVEQPVRLLDVMPTILELVQVPVPAGLEGRSLRPLLGVPDAPVELPERFVAETRFRGSRKLGFFSPGWLYIENRLPHPGTPPRELQPWGKPQDGIQTDRSSEAPEQLEEYAAWLEAWEKSHPEVAALRPRHQMPAEQREQLRALGYVD